MKKLLVGCYVCCFVTFILWADTNVYMFQGMKTFLDNKSTTTTELREQVSYVYDEYSNKDIAVVAHSQGGVRALAMASRFTTAGKAAQIKALITIGSPVKGYSPLLAGKAVLVERMENTVNDAYKGIVAALPLGPIAYIGSSRMDVYDFLCKYIFNSEDIQGIFTGALIDSAGIRDLMPGAVPTGQGAYNPTTGQTEAGDAEEVRSTGMTVTINDLAPGRFMAETVDPVIRGTIKYYRKVTGRTVRSEYVQVGPGSYILEEKVTYKYSYFIGVDVRSSTPRISSAIPIGFVVGQENNPLELIDDKTIRRAGKVACDAIEVALLVAEGVNRTLQYGSIIQPWAISYYKHKADACEKAKHIFGNPANTLGKLLGSSSNDCLILQNDQSRPLTGIGGIGGRPVDPQGTYIAYAKAHHLNEETHPAIWGGSGEHGRHGDNVTWTTTSIVGRWLATRINNTAGTVTK